MSAAAHLAPADDRRWRFAIPDAGSLTWLYVLIAVLGSMHLSMVFGRAINWDEFWYYSQVEMLSRGEFLQPLQTIHTRLFYWWLPDAPGSTIDHIIIARVFMFACLLAIAAGIALAAEPFCGRQAALLAAAAYLGSGFVLQHGTSFRVDPILTALLMTGLAIAARTRLEAKWIVALGGLIGLSAMVSIKFVLWAPAFAGVALLRWHGEGFDYRYPLRWVIAGIVAGSVFAVLYFLHSSGASGLTNSVAGRTLDNSAAKMFGFLQSPYIGMMQRAALIAAPLAVAALLAPLVIWRGDGSAIRKSAWLGPWSMLLVPLFYHNSAPYVYTFLLPPVAVVSAFSMRFLAGRYGQLPVAIFISLVALVTWSLDERGVLDRQERLVTGVETIVAGPVAYFDCCGMVAGFTKANGFMTPWGIQLYRQQNAPVFRNRMEAEPVPVLLDNQGHFGPIFDTGAQSFFHPDDAEALRSTYLPYWGDLYLAGRKLKPGTSLEWEVLVPGTYTVVGSLRIAGLPYSDGEEVALQRGKVEIDNGSGRPAGLVWSTNHARPAGSAPRDYWTGF